MSEYRLVTYQAKSGPRAGIMIGEMLYDAASATGRKSYANMTAILEDWQHADEKFRQLAPENLNGHPRAQSNLRAPVLWPSTIYCAGINYRDHAAEMLHRWVRDSEPDPKALLGKPWHFLKAPRSIADPGATVDASGYSQQLDWEIELAAIIGIPARHVPVEHALDYVAGYTIANELSARDRTRRVTTPQDTPFHFDWVGQKSFEGACPLGPVIVPRNDIPDPQNLSMRLWVNNVVKQDSNSSQMIFSLAEQIAQLSNGITLHPGDIILTGTPAGVGAGRGEFLKAGDTVIAMIEGIGTLTTHIA